MKHPQLSLRDLFWLVLVCALVLGWWLDRNQQTRERERLNERILELESKAAAEAAFRAAVQESNELAERMRQDRERLEKEVRRKRPKPLKPIEFDLRRT